MKKFLIILILMLVSLVTYGYKYGAELGFGVGSNATNFRMDGHTKFFTWMPGFHATANFPLNDVVTVGASYFYSPRGQNNYGAKSTLQAFSLQVGLITSDYATASIGVETTQPTFNGTKYDRRYHAIGTVWIYPFTNFKHFGLFGSGSTSFRVNVGVAVRF